MKSKSYFLLLAVVGILWMSWADPSTCPIGLAQDTDKGIRDLKIIVGIFKEEDAEFFNEILKADDIVFTYGVKLRLLRRIRGPKLMFGRQSIADIERELGRLKDRPVHYINYNPEQWASSNTPRQEIDGLLEGVRRVRKLVNQRGAKLSFATDHILLERYGDKIAPLVDLFGIQLQRYQREPLEEFRREALKRVAIVRRGSKEVPICLQLSLAPPKWEIITKPDGQRLKALVRGEDGKKLLEPIKLEMVLAQIETIKDLAEAIALLYTEETRNEMKGLISLLRR